MANGINPIGIQPVKYGLSYKNLRDRNAAGESIPTNHQHCAAKKKPSISQASQITIAPPAMQVWSVDELNVDKSLRRVKIEAFGAGGVERVRNTSSVLIMFTANFARAVTNLKAGLWKVR